MMPCCILNALEKNVSENAIYETLKEEKKQGESIKKYCDEEDNVDEYDHSLIGQLSMAYISSNDKDMQRILRDTDNRICTLAMMGMKDQARKKIEYRKWDKYG